MDIHNYLMENGATVVLTIILVVVGLFIILCILANLDALVRIFYPAKYIAKKRCFNWRYDTNTLTITGHGYMPKYWFPWPKSLKVNKLVIEDGVLSICDNAFKHIDMSSCKSIYLSNTLEFIGETAFGSYHGERIIFPNTLKRIKSRAFEQAHTDYYFKTNNPPKIGKDVFGTSYTIVVPLGCLEKYVTSSGWSSLNANQFRTRDVSLMHLTFTEVKELEEARKKEEKMRQQEELKNKEERRKQAEEDIRRQQAEEKRKKEEEEANIFDWDYDSNSKTLSISGKGHIPEGWKAWPDHLIIDTIVVKSGITSIPNNFLGKYSMINRYSFHIVLEDNLQSIGNFAFHNVIEDVRFPNTVRKIGDHAFNRLQGKILNYSVNSTTYKTAYLIIGENIEYIGEEAFGLIDGYYEIHFKSRKPPMVKNSVLYKCGVHSKIGIKVPKGSYKEYISSPSFANYVNDISEMDVNKMDPEEIRRKKREEEKREEERLKVEAEKKRIEEEKKRKEDEDRKRREDEDRKKKEKEEEAAYAAKYEAELRKKMGL